MALPVEPDAMEVPLKSCARHESVRVDPDLSPFALRRNFHVTRLDPRPEPLTSGASCAAMANQHGVILWCPRRTIGGGRPDAARFPGGVEMWEG